MNRRQLFKLLGLGSLSLLAPKSAFSAQCIKKDDKTTAYPFYGHHQSGITTPHQKFNITCAFDVLAKNRAELTQMFQILTQRIEFLTQGGELIDPESKKYPPTASGILGKYVYPNGLTITVGVGASLFDQRFDLTDKKPKHLQEYKRFPNDKLKAKWSDGDLSIQICAHNPETCQNALRDLIKNLSAFALIRWSLDGFLPEFEAPAPRNLFGFHDGTNNPDVSDEHTAQSVLWTGYAENSLDEPNWTKGGTYQVIRLIRHFVEFWDRTPLGEQEAIFGRDKYSGARLEALRDDSHIQLADTSARLKHRIFRRPYNYSLGLSPSNQLNVGLIFICYQANLDDGFIFLQERLNLEPLEEYIEPFGGGYFFILPAVEKGQYLAQSLLN